MSNSNCFLYPSYVPVHDMPCILAYWRCIDPLSDVSWVVIGSLLRGTIGTVGLI